MDEVNFLGNITGDIYYNKHIIDKKEVMYLRIIVMRSKSDYSHMETSYYPGMRIVLLGKDAELYYPYLKRGSKIFAVGSLEKRFYQKKDPKTKSISKNADGKNPANKKKKKNSAIEIMAKQLFLIDKIDWERGEKNRTEKGLGELSKNFYHSSIGTVGEVNFQMMSYGKVEYPFLRFFLNEKTENASRVILRGWPAKHIYGFINKGSEVYVSGVYLKNDINNGADHNGTATLLAKNVILSRKLIKNIKKNVDKNNKSNIDFLNDIPIGSEPF